MSKEVTARLNTVLLDSITDGPGVNLVLVFQGCKFNCKNCHNPGTHDLNGGRECRLEPLLKMRTASTTGITLSGGEPTLQLDAVKWIARRAHELGLTVTLYTGNTLDKFKEIVPDYAVYFDYVKVGPYIEELRSSVIPYYGSSNQELYEVKKDGSLVPWRDNGLLDV